MNLKELNRTERDLRFLRMKVEKGYDLETMKPCYDINLDINEDILKMAPKPIEKMKREIDDIEDEISSLEDEIDELKSILSDKERAYEEAKKKNKKTSRRTGQYDIYEIITLLDGKT